MQIQTTIPETRTALRALRPHAETLGLVPTMGALHAGHLSLIRAARAHCDRVAATIFVNPLQFAPGEDLARYPRTFAEDCALLANEGVDLLFAPTPEIMYPPGAPTTFVEVPGIGDRLDGLSRPGHFRGVATVVAKLFHILTPTHAFFGQKDAAQLAVLRAMVRDLNFPLELIACPTIRDPDGLALSSRNRYLSPAERTQALALSRALRAVETAFNQGETSAQKLRTLLLQTLTTPSQNHPERSAAQSKDLRVAQPTDHLTGVPLLLDYAEIVDPDTLLPVTSTTQGALIAIAAKVGQTRLIDNLLIETSEPK